MQQIEVHIMDRAYKLACEPHQVDAIRAAGRKVDSAMRQLRINAPRLDFDKVAVMAALSICQELMNAHQDNQQMQDAQLHLQQEGEKAISQALTTTSTLLQALGQTVPDSLLSHPDVNPAATGNNGAAAVDDVIFDDDRDEPA